MRESDHRAGKGRGRVHNFDHCCCCHLWFQEILKDKYFIGWKINKKSPQKLCEKWEYELKLKKEWLERESGHYLCIKHSVKMTIFNCCWPKKTTVKPKFLTISGNIGERVKLPRQSSSTFAVQAFLILSTSTSSGYSGHVWSSCKTVDHFENGKEIWTWATLCHLWGHHLLHGGHFYSGTGGLPYLKWKSVVSTFIQIIINGTE